MIVNNPNNRSTRIARQRAEEYRRLADKEERRADEEARKRRDVERELEELKALLAQRTGRFPLEQGVWCQWLKYLLKKVPKISRHNPNTLPMITSYFDAGANTQRYVNAADFEIQNVSVQIPIFDCSYHDIYYLPFLGAAFFPYYSLAPIQKISSVGPSISTKDDWSSVCVNQSECYMRHHASHCCSFIPILHDISVEGHRSCSQSESKRPNVVRESEMRLRVIYAQ
jgi:hypothetical protein